MGVFGTIGSFATQLKKGGSLANIIKGIQSQQQQGGQLPVDNSHTHESKAAQEGASTMGAAPEPQQINRSMVNDNKFASAGAQQLGTNFWQGDKLAAQTAAQRSTPTPIPGQEQLSGGRPENDTNIAPLLQVGKPNNGVMDDINEQSKKVGDYMESKSLAGKHMKQYKDAKTEEDKKKVVAHSEKHGDELIND